MNLHFSRKQEKSRSKLKTAFTLCAWLMVADNLAAVLDGYSATSHIFPNIPDSSNADFILRVALPVFSGLEGAYIATDEALEYINNIKGSCSARVMAGHVYQEVGQLFGEQAKQVMQTVNGYATLPGRMIGGFTFGAAGGIYSLFHGGRPTKNLAGCEKQIRLPYGD